MPARVFPLFLSILFVASCGAMNSAQLAGGTVFILAARVEQCRGEIRVFIPGRTRGTMPWNNAVRTRGVFTHRDDFQKPACAERGLVRTAEWPGPGLEFQQPEPKDTDAGTPEPRDTEAGTPKPGSKRIGDRGTRAARGRISLPEFAQDGEGTALTAKVRAGRRGSGC